MTQNSWKILVTKSIDDAMHCYFFFNAKKEGKFPSWGNLPIWVTTHTPAKKLKHCYRHFRIFFWKSGYFLKILQFLQMWRSFGTMNQKYWKKGNVTKVLVQQDSWKMTKLWTFVSKFQQILRTFSIQCCCLRIFFIKITFYLLYSCASQEANKTPGDEVYTNMVPSIRLNQN